MNALQRSTSSRYIASVSASPEAERLEAGVAEPLDRGRIVRDRDDRRASVSRIASGSPGGPNRQSQAVWSTPATPASAMVGTFGIDCSRRVLATASIFSRGFVGLAGADRRAHHVRVDRAGKQIVGRLRAALVLDVLHGDAGLLHEQLADQMREAADSRWCRS